MTPEEFKKQWIAKGDVLFIFRSEAVDSLRIPAEQKSFLTSVGLPEEAAPFLSFGGKLCESLPTVSEMWKQPEEFEIGRAHV